jgi:hypothetical protein
MRRARTSRFGLALLLLCSGLFAAALAHLAIDALGDVLLAHDTYDDAAHETRSVLAAFALAALAAFALRHLVGALRGRSSMRALVPRAPAIFVLATVGVALAALGAMECLDATLAGQRLDDLGDVFGGSLALGATTLVVCAMSTAFGTIALLRALARATIAIVRAVRALTVASARGADLYARRARRQLRALRPAFALRSCKRGPPLVSTPAR